MGVVEEARQIIQDFLAQELRSIAARLDAQDEISETRYKEQQVVAEARQKEIDHRFDAIESRSESRFNQLVLRIQALQETVVDRNDSAQKLLIAKLTQDFEFDKRLTELERERRLGQSTAA